MHTSDGTSYLHFVRYNKLYVIKASNIQISFQQMTKPAANKLLQAHHRQYLPNSSTAVTERTIAMTGSTIRSRKIGRACILDRLSASAPGCGQAMRSVCSWLSSMMQHQCRVQCTSRAAALQRRRVTNVQWGRCTTFPAQQLKVRSSTCLCLATAQRLSRDLPAGCEQHTCVAWACHFSSGPENQGGCQVMAEMQTGQNLRQHRLLATGADLKLHCVHRHEPCNNKSRHTCQVPAKHRLAYDLADQIMSSKGQLECSD